MVSTLNKIIKDGTIFQRNVSISSLIMTLSTVINLIVSHLSRKSTLQIIEVYFSLLSRGYFHDDNKFILFHFLWGLWLNNRVGTWPITWNHRDRLASSTMSHALEKSILRLLSLMFRCYGDLVKCLFMLTCNVLLTCWPLTCYSNM